MKRIISAHRRKPNIFHPVFPIGFRAASFFALPRDPILHQKIFLKHVTYDQTRSPITTHINRRCLFEQRKNLPHPFYGIFPIFFSANRIKFIAMIIFCQIIGRIHDQQIHKIWRQFFHYLKCISNNILIIKRIRSHSAAVLQYRFKLIAVFCQNASFQIHMAFL